MAMEEIIVRLGVDSSGFVNVIDQANEKLDAAGGFVDRLGSKLATLVSAAALLNLAKQATEYASNMNDSAEATRTGVEEYQALATVARESGASMQQLDQALIKATTNGEKAAGGAKEMQQAFAVLNINVDQFNSLPTERKLETIGEAYVSAGRSQEAYTAITEILGTKSAPRLMSALEQLGTVGFDAVRQKADEAGLVLSRVDAIKLDRLNDTVENWWTRTLIFVGDVIAAYQEMGRWVSGENRSQIAFEDIDPSRAAERLNAINQLIEEDFAAHQARMAELGSRRNPYYDEAAAKAKIVNGIEEDEERIQARILEILETKSQKEAEAAAFSAERTAALQRQAALEQMSADNLSALNMLEEGRALLKLKAMTDEERLLVLQGLHVEAVQRVNAMELLGEGTKKEKEEIVKRVLEIEKQIGDTQAKIATDESKAGEARLKTQTDLLGLIEEQAALQGLMDQGMFNEYGRAPDDLASGGGTSSTLTSWAQAASRATESAQRNFDTAAAARARAAGLTGGARDAALRAADEADARAASAEARRRQLEGQITTAQGGAETGDPLVDKMEENRKEIEKLREQLKRI